MKEYYLINEVSKITEIPVSTLRYYSNENLVTPAFKDKSNNYNYYSLEQIFNLKLEICNVMIYFLNIIVIFKGINKPFKDF